jgi:hypothetical protein
MLDKKNILLSKTFWTNVVVAVAYPFLPDAYKNPEYFMYLLSAVNVALRLISKGKVVLLP